LAAGAESRDFFAFAQGKEQEKYLGFIYGKSTTPILDSSLLLIEPATAAIYLENLRAAEDASRAKPPGTWTGDGPAPVDAILDGKGGTGGIPAGPSSEPTKTQFYGTVDLDPILAKKQFADVVDEIVQNFTTRTGVAVKISVEIQAESGAGFDASLQRTVKENSKVLKFKNSDFE